MPQELLAPLQNDQLATRCLKEDRKSWEAGLPQCSHDSTALLSYLICKRAAPLERVRIKDMSVRGSGNEKHKVHDRPVVATGMQEHPPTRHRRSETTRPTLFLDTPSCTSKPQPNRSSASAAAPRKHFGHHLSVWARDATKEKIIVG